MTVRRRPVSFIKALPEGYDYRFIDFDGEIRLMGIHHEKKPIVVDLDGTIREIEVKFEFEANNGEI